MKKVVEIERTDTTRGKRMKLDFDGDFEFTFSDEEDGEDDTFWIGRGQVKAVISGMISLIGRDQFMELLK